MMVVVVITVQWYAVEHDALAFEDLDLDHVLTTLSAGSPLGEASYEAETYAAPESGVTLWMSPEQ